MEGTVNTRAAKNGKKAAHSCLPSEMCYSLNDATDID